MLCLRCLLDILKKCRVGSYIQQSKFDWMIEIVIFNTWRVNETINDINVDRKSKRIKNWVLNSSKLRNKGEGEVKEVKESQWGMWKAGRVLPAWKQ